MTSRAGTGVSILEGRDTTLSPPEKGNVYLNDNAWSSGSRAPTDIEVEWQADTLLLIRQHPGAHVVFAATKFSDVTITYDTIR